MYEDAASGGFFNIENSNIPLFLTEPVRPYVSTMPLLIFCELTSDIYALQRVEKVEMACVTRSGA
jgi:hypothetical protein